MRIVGMNKNTGRIQIHGNGVGEISETDIEQRAAEIARMDGRTQAAAQDRLAAREELQHPGPQSESDADEAVAPVELWSEAAASYGHRGVNSALEDEQSAGEKLVNEGVEEADSDQRLSASEEQPGE